MQKMFHVLFFAIVFFNGSLYGMEPEKKSKVSQQKAAWKDMNFREKIVHYIQAEKHNYQRMFGVTLLFSSCQLDNLEYIHLLLDAQADVNLATNAGCIPLHVASETGNIEVVKLLLDAGSNVYLKNCRGHTALEIAQEFRHTEIAELIVKQMKCEKLKWKKSRLAQRKTW